MARYCIEEILSQETMDISDSQMKNKTQLFRFMASMFWEAGKIYDQECFLTSLFEREDTGSTYMGNGLVVPHGKSETVRTPSIALCRFRPFVYNEDQEDEIAEIALMLAIPSSTDHDVYLGMLADITRLFLDDEFLEFLKKETDKTKVLEEFSKRYQKTSKNTKERMEKSC